MGLWREQTGTLRHITRPPPHHHPRHRRRGHRIGRHQVQPPRPRPTREVPVPRRHRHLLGRAGDPRPRRDARPAPGTDAPVGGVDHPLPCEDLLAEGHGVGGRSATAVLRLAVRRDGWRHPRVACGRSASARGGGSVARPPILAILNSNNPPYLMIARVMSSVPAVNSLSAISSTPRPDGRGCAPVADLLSFSAKSADQEGRPWDPEPQPLPSSNRSRAPFAPPYTGEWGSILETPWTCIPTGRTPS